MKSLVGKNRVIAVAAVLMALRLFAATTVDVLVAYDQSAVRWLRDGLHEATTFAQAAVDRMNVVLSATDLDKSFTFHLAGVKISQAEAVGNDEATRLENTLLSVASDHTGRATGRWQDIQNARDACRADVVAVLIDLSQTAGNVRIGGMSWCLERMGGFNLSAFAPFAYSICDVASVEGHDILVHEVGHLMGAGHSEFIPDEPGPQLDDYSRAYHFIDGSGCKRYTIMGYPYKTRTDVGYRPYPAFSSSEFTTPEGDALGDALHDNTRTLRETCSIVSRFRISGNEGMVPSSTFAKKTTVTGKVLAGDAVVGLVQVTVSKTDKNGQSKVAATVYGLDGKRKSAKSVKARLTRVDGWARLENVALVVKGETTPLILTVGSDGSISGTFGGRKVVGPIPPTGLQSATPKVYVDLGFALGVPGELGIYDGCELVPFSGEPFMVKGEKWMFRKAAPVKWTKVGGDKTNYHLVGLDDVERPNLSSVKLVFSPKTGTFKGTFRVYALQKASETKTKLKKYLVKVTGVVAEGVGFGEINCGKVPVGPFHLNIR